MNPRVLLTVVVLATLVPVVARAQSLGDLARAEADRRAAATPSKRYTDADLPYTPPPVVASAPAAAPVEEEATDTAEAAASVAAPLAGREKRDEQYWKARSHELLARVQAAREQVEAAESSLKDLDAAPSSPALARERDVTAAAALKLRQDLQFQLDELQRFEQRAKTKNVNESWLR